MENHCDLKELQSIHKIPSKVSNSNERQTIDKRPHQVEKQSSFKLKQSSANKKHRSNYLKRYVYNKIPKYKPRFRQLRRVFLLPVVHVKRRPENPYDVKNIVKSLKKQQLMVKSTREPPTEHKSYYLNLQKIVKSKHWESIRYKNQLDYKERTKMERQTILSQYSENHKTSPTQQPKAVNYNNSPFYQKSAVTKTNKFDVSLNMLRQCSVDTQKLPLRRNPLLHQTMEKNIVATKELDLTYKPILLAQHRKGSTATEKRTYPPFNDDTANFCNIGDIGADDDLQMSDNKKKHLRPLHQNVQNTSFQDDSSYQDHAPDRIKRQPERNDEASIERLKNTDPASSHTNEKQTPNDSSIKMQPESYDFSIPFNESNIFIKVMSPEGKTQRLLGKRSTVETKNKVVKKQKVEDPKKNRYDREQVADTNLSNADESQWTEYIQNITKRSQEPNVEVTNKRIDSNSRAVIQPLQTFKPGNLRSPTNNMENRYFDEGCIANEKRGIQTDIVVNGPAVVTSSSINCCGNSPNEPIKHNSLPSNSTSLIRPKVWHPSQYVGSDALRHNSRYSLDETFGVGRPPMYTHIPPIEDATNEHLNYFYNYHLGNYHPNISIYPNRRMVPEHPGMRLPILNPNDQPYGPAFQQYRKEFHPIPRPCLEPFGRNNMHPHNVHLDCLQSRRPSIDPRMYGYLNEQPIHPMWFYQHITER